MNKNKHVNDFLYTLNGKIPVKETNTMKWARWMETANRTIFKTRINDSIQVSTVFTGINHNLSSQGLPKVFETMVFGGEIDQEIERHESWGDAEKGHEKICAIVIALAAYKDNE